ncbi:MAG: DUF362 domain-containing protein [Candidatus Promineifilaceae bacterium]
MTTVKRVAVGDDLRSSIAEAVGGVGGFGSFIEVGDTVLLKPNFNSADPFPASTDLEFLRCVVQLTLEQKPERIIIGESSAINENTSKNLAVLGVRELESLSPNVQVIDLGQTRWIQKRIPGAKYLRKVRVPQLLDQMDKIVLLPCLKTHHLAQFTGSLKLSVAFMRPRERISLHIRNLQQKVAELNTLIHPDLIIMDARKCFITGGPSTGEVREPNLILSGTDRVALDIEGIKIIQGYPGNSLAHVNPLDIPQIKVAIGMGIGEGSQLEEIVADRYVVT